MRLKNRFFKSAVWEALATEDGHMTAELMQIYEELAKGGVGTIFTGYAYIEKDEHPNPRMMGIYEDSFIDEYKELTSLVHTYDANIIMQIVYGGSMTNLDPPSPVIWGPSAVRNELTGVLPKEMDKSDIAHLVQSFGKAAARVKQAGFDGVEIHAAHGYLLSQFLGSHYNTRTDEYGGSLENRSRIIVEVYKEIRKSVGKDFPVMIKINSEDFMTDGLTSEESILVSQMLEKLGIDAIEVSGGNESSPFVYAHNLGPARKKVAVSLENESYFALHAAKLAKAVSLPVILTGGNRHREVMQNLLDTTDIEYVALGRPLIAEPDLIARWKAGDGKAPKCISCNQCYKTYGKRCVFNGKKLG